MNKYVVLLRAVNVGGKNILPMKELKLLLESNGLQNVSTYIQSGNIVLHSDHHPSKTVEDLIEQLIESKFGFAPQVLVLSEAEFEHSVRVNPFSGEEGKFMHFYYCKQQLKVDAEKLQKFASDTEACKWSGNVFYLHAPDGIGRSKLVANIESCLGVPATGRNLNTINKICSMIGRD